MKTKEPKIIYKEPDFPAYKKACEKFGVSFHKGIVFTYGDKVYTAKKLDRGTIVHEKTHMRQHSYKL